MANEAASHATPAVLETVLTIEAWRLGHRRMAFCYGAVTAVTTACAVLNGGPAEFSAALGLTA